MTTTAILMMIVAILVVWGGLVLAVVYLMRHPLEEDTHGDFLDEPEAHHL
ncbi:methionine/alanine import family NSS transporter small subunit [Georgenia daeguensis]|uniref:Methionine/alanine import family NSS transporter small subunit n=1 Tax=Georgenia daeguensis TaxID=908355 RepID=A0ABP6UKF2_9MICO